MIRIDMVKARDVWRDHIRRRRQPLLEELDREYMRADEAGDTKSKKGIAAKKKKLRDAPEDPRIEAATSPEDLKAIDPLGGDEE